MNTFFDQISKPPMFKCTNKNCGAEYPRTNEYFHKNKRSKDGLHNYCKPCARVKGRTQHRKDKKERVFKEKSSDGVVHTSVKCKRCKKPTEKKYINVDFLEHVRKHSLCQPCKDLLSGDNCDLYEDTPVNHYPDGVQEVQASELPLMDSTGGG